MNTGDGELFAAESYTNHPVLTVLGRPTYEPFPGVETTHFGENVPAEGATAYACEMLRQHFEQKEALKARVNFLAYQARKKKTRLCFYYHQWKPFGGIYDGGEGDVRR